MTQDAGTPSAARPVVALEFDGEVAIVTLDRPDRLNAVNPALVDQLVTSLREIAAKDAGCVILTGRGRAFCAGHDLKQERPDDASLWQRLDRLQDVTRAIRELPIPVIAAVHGHAVGAGAEFALGCDLVIASSEARFRFPEVGLGLSVTGGMTKLLGDLVGPLKAKELILLGEPFDAIEALRLGLVNRVVSAAELMPFALEWARRLAAQPRTSTALAKSALDAGSETTLAGALSLEVAHAMVTDNDLGDQDSALSASRARNA
jgi:2-(1,2-epoxy-1,2-dihydrophenyl)acetyl-CoA isomerase